MATLPILSWTLPFWIIESISISPVHHFLVESLSDKYCFWYKLSLLWCQGIAWRTVIRSMHEYCFHLHLQPGIWHQWSKHKSYKPSLVSLGYTDTPRKWTWSPALTARSIINYHLLLWKQASDHSPMYTNRRIYTTDRYKANLIDSHYVRFLNQTLKGYIAG